MTTAIKCPQCRSDSVITDGDYNRCNNCTYTYKAGWKAFIPNLNSEGDPVLSPRHYTQHPSGIECIQITEHMNFNLGNAVKYIWRAGLKSSDPTEDLRKARQSIDREIARIEASRS